MATGARPERVRRDYCLHSSDAEEANGDFHGAGFIRIAPEAAEPGDLLLVRPAATALHVVVLTECGYLHADMRLRKVVEVPSPVPWPVLSAWRHPAKAAEDPLAPELVGPSLEIN